MKDCIIYDLDGTLCDLMHRLHYIRKIPKDYDSFHNNCAGDTPKDDIIYLANLLVTAWHEDPNSFDLFICSGRPETTRDDTEKWLLKYVPRLLEVVEGIFMRKENDFRSDIEVKLEMKKAIEGQGYNIRTVFDDRQKVVDHVWRANGITCCQVAAWDEEKIIVEPGTLHLMVGPSGAGKSVLASKIFPKSEILSSDEFRKEVTGDHKDMTKDSLVWGAIKKIALARLEAGLDVVIDATNIKNKNRKEMKNIQYPNGTIYYHIFNRSIKDKITTGDWRNEIKVNNKSLIEYHEEVFQNNLNDILNGDNDSRVIIKDWRNSQNITHGIRDLY